MAGCQRLPVPLGAGIAFVSIVLLRAPSAFGDGGLFVEFEKVIHKFSQPTGQFGWGIAELTDIDDPADGVLDFIIPSPGTNTVYVYSGQSGNLIHTLTPPGGTPANAFFGHAVADAGDVDMDGVNDIIVGANRASTGFAFVYSGADGSLIHSLAGEATLDAFGFGVGGAGDVNEDGHSDVLVGAPNAGTAGRAYIYSGIDGSLIRILEPTAGGTRFGNGTAGTGDIDGDGIGDQIVGATIGAKAYIFSGADGSVLFHTTGDAGAAAYGQFFVAGVGDVNNDGTRDVYVGDFGSDNGAGKAYVYSGVDGAVLHVFAGSNVNEGVGPGRGAGDVDGDGYADLLVGHWTSNTGATGAGKATVFSGQTGAAVRVITSITRGENFGFDAVGVGDIDGDGEIDFLVSAATQNRVYAIGARQTPVCDPSLIDPPGWTGVATNRFLSLDTGSMDLPFGAAVRVHFKDVPPPHDAWNGTSLWVGPFKPLSENSGAVEVAEAPGSPAFTSATLQCAANFADWNNIGLVHVHHRAIVPGGVYEVQTADRVCGAEDPATLSAPVEIPTSKWGDVVQNCITIPCGPPEGSVDIITDAVAVLRKFSNLPGAPIKARSDLEPSLLDLKITISDVIAVVQGFQGFGFPFDPIAFPCEP